jgi:hypothetical protein
VNSNNSSNNNEALNSAVAGATRDEGSRGAAPAKPKVGSNASWPLIAYLAGMAVILVCVAIWQAAA